jgi:hypothetical protein
VYSGNGYFQKGAIPVIAISGQGEASLLVSTYGAGLMAETKVKIKNLSIKCNDFVFYLKNLCIID